MTIGARASTALRPKLRDIAMVFQSYALYPHMTAGQNMALPLRMRRLSAWQRLPFDRPLPAGHVGHQYARSKRTWRAPRERSRSSICSAASPASCRAASASASRWAAPWCATPPCFLMDEPLSNLDAKLRVQMRAEIKELHRRLGVTFIYVTHDQAEAMTMSDRVAVMFERRAVPGGAAAGDLRRPDRPARRGVHRLAARSTCWTAPCASEGIVDVAGSAHAPSRPMQAAGAAVTPGHPPEAFHLAERGGPGIA